MKKFMKKRKEMLLTSLLVVLGSCAILFITGCGTAIKKSAIASTANPSEEIESLELSIRDGYSSQLDVLAGADFSKSKKHLADAKSGLQKGHKQSVILDDVAYAKAYLERAHAKANERLPKAREIVESRRVALQAGAREYPELRENLKNLDEEFRKSSENLDKNLSIEKFTRLQSGYQDLELAAIQTREVGSARSMIAGSMNEDADENAPKSLKTAAFDLKMAENTILSNRHDTNAYRPSVHKANASAQFLVDVMAALKRRGTDLDEADAIKLVKKNYEIKTLKGQVGDAQTAMRGMDRELTYQSRQIDRAQSTMEMQSALERARIQFDSDEAEVFQQGERLLIRLKSMAFPIGRSELPINSLELLAKIKTVASNLHPSEVVVEGHTDSTGSPKANQTLSEKRAASVVEYFQTNGLQANKMNAIGRGFSKPIATNKSPEGRAQNRRVDIIIVPGISERQ